MLVGRNPLTQESILLSPKQKFAKILNRGRRQSMLILCCIYGYARSAYGPCVYSTAWEYCFFIVHSVKAFGDASVLWT